MKPFMDDDFMLRNETARHLYHDYAEGMPIIDYHCHLSPEEIYEDRRFHNMTELWLGGRNADGTYAGDHYKWRLMRAAGIPEEIVTGNADPYTRFEAFAGALELAIGNPMVHWSNLELKTYFGIDKPLTKATAREIWEQTSERLAHDPELSARGIIRKSNVRYVGTTDDPADSLEWHEKLAQEEEPGFLVCPSFRPDKAIAIQKPGFASYIAELGKAVGRTLSSAQDVCRALTERIDFFKAHGCRASDHGLDYFPFSPCSMEEADRIFTKAMAGGTLSQKEIDEYQTTLLLCLARKYHQENIVMEIHYSCSRNNNARMFRLEGPDTGYDMIAKSSCIGELAQFFSALDETGELPKTIVFSLDPSDMDPLAACLGCFQSDEIPGKMQLGAAWWFLDTRDGMEMQMKTLARLGLLGTFVGMLTDSRSFLSYPRHDYFRRILCSLIGEWVENGEYPDDEETLREIIQGICCTNAERYFGLSGLS